MKKCGIALSLLLASCVSAGNIINMSFDYEAYVNQQEAYFVFDVNGVPTQLFCDEFYPNITTQPYLAVVENLSDLSMTADVQNGDSLANALQKYQQIATLDLMGYADPTIAGDVIRANRYILNGQSAMTNEAYSLVNWVQTQDPSKYDLSGFEIFVGITKSGAILPTQEQTGFQIPEPAAGLLTGFSLLGVLLVGRRWRTRSLGLTRS